MKETFMILQHEPQDNLSSGLRHALFSSVLTIHKTPPLYAQENVELHEKTAYAHFYEPASGWNWYATEWDGKETCFGYVEGHEAEWGYFNIREMAEVKTGAGQTIRIDHRFVPGRIPEFIRELPEPFSTNPPNPMKAQKQTEPIQNIPVEHKELLLKLFKGTSVDLPDKSTFVKPLTNEEYDKIRDYVDRRRGGLTRDAHEVADPELRKAAAISQVFKDHRIMDARMKEYPELRDTLLSALKAKPGEKPLTLEQFKDVAVFLDRVNGGLRHYAFNAYRKDEGIVQAAKDHQATWIKREAGKEQGTGQEAAPVQGKPVSKLEERINRKSAGMGQESGVGQEAEP